MADPQSRNPVITHVLTAIIAAVCAAASVLSGALPAGPFQEGAQAVSNVCSAAGVLQQQAPALWLPPAPSSFTVPALPAAPALPSPAQLVPTPPALDAPRPAHRPRAELDGAPWRWLGARESWRGESRGWLAA